MAYEVGILNTRKELMEALIEFCVNNGFAEEGPRWLLGTSQLYSLKKDDVYFNFHVDEAANGYIYMNTGLSAGEFNLTGQVDAHPWNCRTDNLNGPYLAHHFFTDGQSVGVVVEIVHNIFVHFAFGRLEKNGDYVGGEYVTGTAVVSGGSGWSNIFNSYNQTLFDSADVGGSHSNYSSVCGHMRTPAGGPTASLSRQLGTSRCWASATANNYGRVLVNNSPNAFNGRAVLAPVNFLQGSSGTSGPYFQMGTVSNIRILNIANLNPRDIVNTEWMVFPLSQKNGPGITHINSGVWGVAYKL